MWFSMYVRRPLVLAKIELYRILIHMLAHTCVVGVALHQSGLCFLPIWIQSRRVLFSGSRTVCKQTLINTSLVIWRWPALTSLLEAYECSHHNNRRSSSEKAVVPHSSEWTRRNALQQPCSWQSFSKLLINILTTHSDACVMTVGRNDKVWVVCWMFVSYL